MSAVDIIDKKTEDIASDYKGMSSASLSALKSITPEEAEVKLTAQMTSDPYAKTDIYRDASPFEVGGPDVYDEEVEPTIDNFSINAILEPYAKNDNWDEAPEYQLEATVKSLVSNSMDINYDDLDKDDVYAFFDGAESWVDAAKQAERITQQAFGKDKYTRFTEMSQDDRFDVAKEDWLNQAQPGETASNQSILDMYDEKLKYDKNNHIATTRYNQVMANDKTRESFLGILSDGDFTSADVAHINTLSEPNRALLFDAIRTNNPRIFDDGITTIFTSFFSGIADNVKSTVKGAERTAGTVFTEDFDLDSEGFKLNKIEYILDNITQTKYANEGGVIDYARTVSRVIGDMGTTAAIGITTGGTSLLATSTLRYMSDTADSLQYDFGLDSGEALGWGLVSGLAQAGLERLQVGHIVGKAKKSTQLLSKKTTSELRKEIGKYYVATSLYETAEESGQALADSLTKIAAVYASDNADLDPKMFAREMQSVLDETIEAMKVMPAISLLGVPGRAKSNFDTNKRLYSVDVINTMISDAVTSGDKAKIQTVAIATAGYKLSQETKDLFSTAIEPQVVQVDPMDPESPGGAIITDTELESMMTNKVNAGDVELFRAAQERTRVVTDMSEDVKLNIKKANTLGGAQWEASTSKEEFIKNYNGDGDATQIADTLEIRDNLLVDVEESADMKLQESFEEDDDVKYSKTIGEDVIDRVESLKQALPKADIVEIEGGATITLPNGQSINVQLVDEIDTDVEATGAWIDRERILQLTGEGGQFVTDHEVFHAAESLVLSTADIKFLEDNVGDIETRADAYAKWQQTQEAPTTKIGKLFQMIKDVSNKIASIFSKSAKVVEKFKKAQAGKAISDTVEVDQDIRYSRRTTRSNGTQSNNELSQSKLYNIVDTIVARFFTQSDINIQKEVDAIVKKNNLSVSVKNAIVGQVFSNIREVGSQTFTNQEIARRTSQRVSARDIANQSVNNVRTVGLDAPSSAYKMIDDVLSSQQEERDAVDASEAKMAFKDIVIKQYSENIDVKLAGKTAGIWRAFSNSTFLRVANLHQKIESLFTKDVADNIKREFDLANLTFYNSNVDLMNFLVEFETIEDLRKVEDLGKAVGLSGVKFDFIKNEDATFDDAINEITSKFKENHFTGSLSLVMETLRNKDVKKNIESSLGKPFYISIVKHLDDFMNNYRESGDNIGLNKLRAYTSSLNMIGNYRSFMGQLTSIPIAFSEDGLGFSAAPNVFNLKQLKSDKVELEKMFSLISERQASGASETMQDIEKAFGSEKWKKLGRNILMPSKLGDALIYNNVLALKYRQELDAIQAKNKAGIIEAQKIGEAVGVQTDFDMKMEAAAMAMAFASKTQQSSSIDLLSDAQRNKISSFFTMFRNTQLLQARIITSSFANLKSAIQNDDGLTGDDLTKRRKSASVALLRNVTTLTVQNATYVGMIHMVNRLLLGMGDEDEALEEYFSNVVLSSIPLLTGFSGMPLVDAGMTKVSNEVLGWSDYYKKLPAFMMSSESPVISIFDKLERLTKQVGDIADGDHDSAKSEADDALDTVLSSWRQISATIENIDDDRIEDLID